MDRPAFRNKLLRRLDPAAFEQLGPHLERVELKVRDVIVRPNATITHVYFPETGLMSILAGAGHSDTIEAGMVGFEGMSDMIPSKRTPLQTMVHLPGHAYRIEFDLLDAVFREGGKVTDLISRYHHYLIVQSAYLALSHANYNVEERLARWLLMALDRTGGRELPLAHDFFAWMLAVRRAGVTAAMQSLEDRGAISRGRARVVVEDRDILIELAATSYGQAEAAYERLIACLPEISGVTLNAASG